MIARNTLVVVPCYNEAQRLDVNAFQRFAATTPDIGFVFVNDGSTDDTAAVLKVLVASAPDRFISIDCDRNRGKAEAVRRGMLHALDGPCRYAGYWDADLATPLSEIPRFVRALEAHREREICFGARVQLLGREIHRRAHRHYGGRLFAAVASIVLGLPVYDTQCGAKLFRVSEHTRALFAQPFLGRWTFDIEIIARLAQELASSGGRRPADAIYELPLEEWRDVHGSQVRSIDFVLALVQLARIRSRYFSTRKAVQNSSKRHSDALPIELPPPQERTVAPGRRIP